MCVRVGGGGETTAHNSLSFDDFLPDLTSRRAHLMQFQLPQTIPQPQRSRECGITVGRRGARGQATRRAGGRGAVRKYRPAAARRLHPPPGPERGGRSPHTRCWLGVGGGEMRGTGLLPPTSPGRAVPPPLPEIHFLKN